MSCQISSFLEVNGDPQMFGLLEALTCVFELLERKKLELSLHTLAA